MQLPTRGKIYSFNEANRWLWDKPLQVPLHNPERVPDPLLSTCKSGLNVLLSLSSDVLHFGIRSDAGWWNSAYACANHRSTSLLFRLARVRPRSSTLPATLDPWLATCTAPSCTVASSATPLTLRTRSDHGICYPRFAKSSLCKEKKALQA